VESFTVRRQIDKLEAAHTSQIPFLHLHKGKNLIAGNLTKDVHPRVGLQTRRKYYNLYTLPLVMHC
jgi:hypothetical protein